MFLKMMTVSALAGTVSAMRLGHYVSPSEMRQRRRKRVAQLFRDDPLYRWSNPSLAHEEALDPESEIARQVAEIERIYQERSQTDTVDLSKELLCPSCKRNLAVNGGDNLEMKNLKYWRKVQSVEQMCLPRNHCTNCRTEIPMIDPERCDIGLPPKQALGDGLARLKVNDIVWPVSNNNHRRERQDRGKYMRGKNPYRITEVINDEVYMATYYSVHSERSGYGSRSGQWNRWGNPCARPERFTRLRDTVKCVEEHQEIYRRNVRTEAEFATYDAATKKADPAFFAREQRRRQRNPHGYGSCIDFINEKKAEIVRHKAQGRPGFDWVSKFTDWESSPKDEGYRAEWPVREDIKNRLWYRRGDFLERSRKRRAGWHPRYRRDPSQRSDGSWCGGRRGRAGCGTGGHRRYDAEVYRGGHRRYNAGDYGGVGHAIADARPYGH